MTVEETLQKIVISASAFSNIAGNRLYQVVLPDDPKLPAASYQRITTTRTYTTTGPVKLNRIRFQFDCWASSYKEVKQLQAALLSIFEDRTLLAGTGIESIQLITTADGFESDARIYRVTSDFYVWALE
jgi:hypothetical protein